MVELYPLADRAAVSHVEIADWAIRAGELYSVGDADELQRITVEAESSAHTVTTGAHSPSPMTSDRLRPLDLKQFLQLSIKTREMLLDPILPEKGLAMLYAARGTGKTHVALGICFAVATGTKFLKWVAPKPRRVLLIDGEMPAAALQERLASIVASAPGIQLDPDNIKILAGDLIEAGGIGNLASSDVQAEIDRWLDGIDVFALDNLSSLTAVIRDNDAESWGPIQEWLTPNCVAAAISVLIVHHAGKDHTSPRRADVKTCSIPASHCVIRPTIPRWKVQGLKFI